MKNKGAIFDTERVYQKIWRELAVERGITLGDDFVKTISGTSGLHMRQIVEDYYHVSDGTETIGECMKRVREELSVHVPVKKGVPEILDFFRRNSVPIAVASSTAKELIESNLKTAGIREYFAEIVSGTEVAHGKPAPDIFLLAAERICREPGDCYVFEDSENGIRAGHAAGCRTVMVPDLIEASPEIRPYCTFVCADLEEAVKKIKTEVLEDQGRNNICHSR